MPQKLRARITGVAPKRNRAGDETGWFSITTDGTPKTLETSQQDLIEEAYRWKDSGLLLDIDFEEQESGNINQHTGKPYVNRYYNGASAVTNGASGDETRPEPRGVHDPGFGYRTYPDDAWRICLSVGLERAIQLAIARGEGLDKAAIAAETFDLATMLFSTPPPPTTANDLDSIPFGEKPSGNEPAPYISDDWPGD